MIDLEDVELMMMTLKISNHLPNFATRARMKTCSGAYGAVFYSALDPLVPHCQIPQDLAVDFKNLLYSVK